MNKTVKTRFAPSPTGYLHIGGLRTALYAYLFAKKNNGEFHLRIEDTDQVRLVEDSMQNIIDTLDWAGLHHVGTPVIQSQRLKLYQEHADKLLVEGHAYRCFCTKERLDQMRRTNSCKKSSHV